MQRREPASLVEVRVLATDPKGEPLVAYMLPFESVVAKDVLSVNITQ